MIHPKFKNLNVERMNELMRRCKVGTFSPKFGPGSQVRRVSYPDDVGVVDAVYADLEAAMDTGLVGSNWYEQLEIKPKSSPTDDLWYSVILPDGAVLCGEKDLKTP